jgi:formate-dependent nitrite reductase membrane component NrfD
MDMPTEVELIRRNHLIDPQLQIWGWEIPVYLFLGGLAAGLMVLPALLALKNGHERSRWLRWSPFAVPVILSVGMLALFLDLELKQHVYRFYAIFRPSSPMSWGAWILVLIYPAALLLGMADLTDEETDRLSGWSPLRVTGLGRLIRWARSQAADHVQGLRWSNIVLGVGLGGYTGILLSTLGARAMWNSSVLGPLFLVSGISTGAAFLMLFGIRHEEHRLLRRWDLAAIGLEVVLLTLFLLQLATAGGAQGQAAAAKVLGGAYTASFWSLVVMVGLVVPFTVELLEARRGWRPTRVAPALILIGGLALRWILVTAGQG